ncbi:ABC transporter permease subunit [Nocardioides sp. cx-173]|uniref:ABC transporter permease subunit n=1 Tax=Nocardioides sp. cx-173 TaxID=2898796 RepID=UPI001E558B9A|nr:ABC transporter permease subunit [Nocardioides sp. cx-173]MCD4526645.1 ABC transporter permease [Nocardioides sp. cx-173]UGB40738.1 ABC transporter permease [Nocardioides sp. cx-173]
MSNVMRSEWTKLRSVRSNVVTLAASAGALLFIGLIFSAMIGGVVGNPPEDAGDDPAGAALAGVQVAQLIIGVLGVLAITSEYSTGTIRTTLTAVPSRLPVLWAKVAVVALATFSVLGVTAFVTFFAGQALIGSGDVDTATLSDPGVLRAVIGSAAFLMGTALLGLALGGILRSTAGAISTLFGIIFVLPGLGFILLPESVREDLLQYLPTTAGSSFTSVAPDTSQLSPGMGAAVFAAWILVPLLGAAVAFVRRPA